MRTLPLILLTGLTSTVVSVLPVVSLPVAAASPVAPDIQEVDLSAPGVLVDGRAGQQGQQEQLRATGGTRALTTGVLEVQDFIAAGATWQESATPVRVSLQVREDGAWSAWEDVPVEDTGPDPGTAEYAALGGRVSTSPLFTDGADAVRVRVETPDGRIPTGLRLAVIDPGTSPADGHLEGSRPAASAEAVVATPGIISRASWGADESLRDYDPEYDSRIKVGIVHHTAGSNSYSPEGAAAQIRAVYAYHVNVNGYNDIAYNFLVDRFGRIYEGRYGGTHRPVHGAHTGGFNTDTFAVSALGDLDVASPPGPMVEAITQVLAWKLSLHGVNPQASDRLTSAGGGTSKYPAGTVVTVPTIMGHRDVGNTACPGRYLYPSLPGMRVDSGRSAEAADFSTALYEDMLGRLPSNAELDGWTRTIARTGDRRVGLAGFGSSEEFRRNSISGAYESVLGRQADATGMATWLSDIAAGRARLDDLSVRLMESGEFYERAGGTSTGFVRALYSRSLNRSASGAEQTSWAGIIATRGRPAAIAGIWNSQESGLRRVNRSYVRWLGRPAAAPEQEYWARTVLVVGDEAMREAAMFSAEYLARAMARF